jgi:hypothetical protein
MDKVNPSKVPASLLPHSRSRRTPHALHRCRCAAQPASFVCSLVASSLPPDIARRCRSPPLPTSPTTLASIPSTLLKYLEPPLHTAPAPAVVLPFSVVTTLFDARVLAFLSPAGSCPSYCSHARARRLSSPSRKSSPSKFLTRTRSV